MATDAMHRREWQARAEKAEAALVDAEGEIAELKEKIADVWAAHDRVLIDGNLGDLPAWEWCRGCGSGWPCDTIRAVNG